MLFYLGELIEVQNRQQEAFVPIVFEDEAGSFRAKTLFGVRRGLNSLEGDLLSVTYDGDRYYIPRVTGDDSTHLKDESMHVISLVTQIIAAQQKSNDLPITPSLR